MVQPATTYPPVCVCLSSLFSGNAPTVCVCVFACKMRETGRSPCTTSHRVQSEPTGRSIACRCAGADALVNAAGIAQRKGFGNVQSRSRVPVAAGWSLRWMWSRVSARELGAENRPLYGEMMQTLIPLGLAGDYFGAFLTLPREPNDLVGWSIYLSLMYSS